MPVSEKSAKYHTLGPVDTCKDEAKQFTVNIVRTTSHTGEQFHFECPVYGSDTREELDARVGMCLSVIQDRLEEENAAFLKIQEDEQKDRMKDEAIRRNTVKLEKDMKALEKDARKQGWKPETLEAKKAELVEKYNKAQATLEEGKTLEEIVEAAPKNLARAEGETGTQESATH